MIISNRLITKSLLDWSPQSRSLLARQLGLQPRYFAPANSTPRPAYLQNRRGNINLQNPKTVVPVDGHNTKSSGGHGSLARGSSFAHTLCTIPTESSSHVQA